MNRTVLALVLVAFGVLTGFAVAQHGPEGIIKYQIQNLAGIQVLVDLAIALGLFLVWMWPDARQSGRNPWFWFAVTAIVGSFGPLLYLVTRKGKPQ